jgi:branched-chain amino acid aminotransferase
MSISEKDWGALYGFSLFETILVHDGAPRWLERHMLRITRSARELGIAGAPDAAALARSIEQRLAANPYSHRVLRLTLTAGNPDSDIAPQVSITDRAISYSAADYKSGFPVALCDAPRSAGSPVVRHKTANQLENLLAWRSAARANCREALFFNTCGFLTEGARSNVFLVAESGVVTPPVEAGLLPGLARERAIAILLQEGIPVREADVHRRELRDWVECFLTNSIMPVLPVSRIGDFHFPAPVPGPVTALVRERMCQELGLVNQLEGAPAC